MQKGIHPENYRLVAFKDMSNDDVFITKSTAESNETIEVDGVEYPLMDNTTLAFKAQYVDEEKDFSLADGRGKSEEETFGLGAGLFVRF